MDRDVPYDNKLKCDICGKPGAFDFMGDYYCHDCVTGCKICGTVIFTANGDVCEDCDETNRPQTTQE